jgi:hypothetical protein
MTLVAAIGILVGASPAGVVLACALDAAAAAAWHAWRGLSDAKDSARLDFEMLLAPLVYAGAGILLGVRMARSEGGLDAGFAIGGLATLIVLGAPLVVDIVREERHGARHPYGWRDRIAVWGAGLAFWAANIWQHGDDSGARPEGATVALSLLAVGAAADLLRLAGRRDLAIDPGGTSTS